MSNLLVFVNYDTDKILSELEEIQNLTNELGRKIRDFEIHTKEINVASENTNATNELL